MNIAPFYYPNYNPEWIVAKGSLNGLIFIFLLSTIINLQQIIEINQNTLNHFNDVVSVTIVI